MKPLRWQSISRFANILMCFFSLSFYFFFIFHFSTRFTVYLYALCTQRLHNQILMIPLLYKTVKRNAFCYSSLFIFIFMFFFQLENLHIRPYRMHDYIISSRAFYTPPSMASTTKTNRINKCNVFSVLFYL